MKLEEIAKQIGVSTSHLCNVINGRSNLTHDKALKAAGLLGTGYIVWVRNRDFYHINIRARKEAIKRAKYE